MSSSSWRKSISVVEDLLENPQQYSFVQAVRLLERASVFKTRERQQAKEITYKTSSNPVARFAPPSKEFVRFKGSSDLKFPGAQMTKLSHGTKENRDQWQLAVNFIGISGAMGVMPFHYTETLLQRLKVRDKSLEDFVELFNHRIISLFFQASSKYRLALEYERAKLYSATKTKDSKHTNALLSLLGIGTRHLQNRQNISDESFIFYSGLLTHQVRTPTGLKQMIQHYFNVPVNVEGFMGQWQELIDDVRTRLPWSANRNGQNVCLGRNTMLGRKGWFAQGKSRISIGPLNKEQYQMFAPSTNALKTLNQLTRSYLGMEQEFDFLIQVKREDVPNKIQLKQKEPPLLAWNAWLSGKPRTNTEKDELLEIIVSSKVN